MNHKYPLFIGAIAAGILVGQPLHAANYITNFQAEAADAKADANAAQADSAVATGDDAVSRPTVMPVSDTPVFYVWDDGAGSGDEDASGPEDVMATTPGMPSSDEGPVASDGPVD